MKLVVHISTNMCTISGWHIHFRGSYEVFVPVKRNSYSIIHTLYFDVEKRSFGRNIHLRAGKYERKIYRVFTTDSFGSSGKETNSLVLVSGVGEQ